MDPRGGKAPPRGGFERGGLYPGGGVEPPSWIHPCTPGQSPPPLLDPYLGNTDPEGEGGGGGGGGGGGLFPSLPSSQIQGGGGGGVLFPSQIKQWGVGVVIGK